MPYDLNPFSGRTLPLSRPSSPLEAASLQYLQGPATPSPAMQRTGSLTPATRSGPSIPADHVPPAILADSPPPVLNHNSPNSRPMSRVSPQPASRPVTRAKTPGPPSDLLNIRHLSNARALEVSDGVYGAVIARPGTTPAAPGHSRASTGDISAHSGALERPLSPGDLGAAKRQSLPTPGQKMVLVKLPNG